MYLYKNTKLLTRFIRQARPLSDTPSLIQLIAADAGYLMVCRAIVGDASQTKEEFIGFIKTVCRIQGLDFHLLQQKLTPVARVLGLIVIECSARLLPSSRISSDADTSEIKKAFREKAYEVHPDTSA